MTQHSESAPKGCMSHSFVTSIEVMWGTSYQEMLVWFGLRRDADGYMVIEQVEIADSEYSEWSIIDEPTLHTMFGNTIAIAMTNAAMEYAR